MAARRTSLASIPGREAARGGPNTGGPGVSREPLLWALFSLGGFITAFLSPITVFLLSLAPVFGLWPTDPAAYVTFAAHWREPLGRLFFFALIGGSLFHGTQRPKFMLVDPGTEGPGHVAPLRLHLDPVAIVREVAALYIAV